MTGVEVVTDLSALKLRVKSDIDRILPQLTEQILKDCNYFCKQDQGTLISSSLTASDIQHGDIIWDTVYAAMQYYLPAAVKDVNPNATAMWCHKAYETYGDAWQKQLQKLVEGGAP